MSLFFIAHGRILSGQTSYAQFKILWRGNCHYLHSCHVLSPSLPLEKTTLTFVTIILLIFFIVSLPIYTFLTTKGCFSLFKKKIEKNWKQDEPGDFTYAMFAFHYSHSLGCSNCPKSASGNPFIWVHVSFWHDPFIFKCCFAFWDNKKSFLPSGTTDLLFTLELICGFFMVTNLFSDPCLYFAISVV